MGRETGLQSRLSVIATTNRKAYAVAVAFCGARVKTSAVSGPTMIHCTTVNPHGTECRVTKAARQEASVALTNGGSLDCTLG